MCGIVGIFGKGWEKRQLESMLDLLHHRGPDAEGLFIDSSGYAGLGHKRLSIIDLSEAGTQPLSDNSGRYRLVFNGEIYNYIELRQELESSYKFRSSTDSEILLASYIKWGEACLEKFEGMFSFLIWDTKTKVAFAARDRFGVKPFYYAIGTDGNLFIASEIKSLHAAGIPRYPDEISWASYFTYGAYDHNEKTFWKNVLKLPAGHILTWKDGGIKTKRWYDFTTRLSDHNDQRTLEEVKEEYTILLRESVKLRFRADVPVGVSLSGGLDSSILLALIRDIHGDNAKINVFTFITGDNYYDELPWVKKMIADCNYPLTPCLLLPEDVPQMAKNVCLNQDEPFGGLPTLAYANLFKTARKHGVIVLLDGQGMDEQLAGYDYYRPDIKMPLKVGPVQGTAVSSVMDSCLENDFKKLAKSFEFEPSFNEPIQNLQYRDIFHAKLPRALRFNDHASMMFSCELREPFLCHKLVECGFRQPQHRKINSGQGKWLLRQIAKDILPNDIVEAPKRPVQTPQREWLQGELAEWAEDCIETTLKGWGQEWFKRDQVKRKWRDFKKHGSNNSFPYWQWINLGLMQ